MWETRIGAAGAILAGGVVFIVLAVFLDRVSDQAAQWMQAGGTVLAFFGLLYVHWDEGRRRRKELRDEAALAAAHIAREMKRINRMATMVIEDRAILHEKNFVPYFDAIKQELAHPRSDMLLVRLSSAYSEVAQFVGLAIDHLAEFWKTVDHARAKLLVVDAGYIERMINRLQGVAECSAVAYVHLEAITAKKRM